jgi:ABC-type multidrug transport system ATPase subunit/ABC-type multidrug transport system permease subunit
VAKDIIKNVSGSVSPGEFLAIIGASGAGKTTLLNFLSGREISQNLKRTGKILLNKQDKDLMPNFSSYSAYVQQDDILFQTMTVRECLTFAARLKLTGTEEEKQARVNVMIATLKLTKCQNTRIGGPLVKGVSGGERKRTSIGVELITDPNLVFLDEPTTGLDSFTATSVMESLGDLARKEHRTVISTIHQPNTDIFDMFDRLVLLARGKIIYFNAASLSVDYFEKIGYCCPELSNPCDYFMSMMSKESIELDHEEVGRVGAAGMNAKSIDEEYERVIEFFDATYEGHELKCDPSYAHPDCLPLAANDSSLSIATPWCYQYKLLATRNFLNVVRLPQTSYVKLTTTCVTSSFVAFFFWQAGAWVETRPPPKPETYEQIFQNLQGGLFFMTMNITMNAIQNVILIFPDERPVFLREVNNNMYKVGPYFWAKITSELPFSIMMPSTFGCIAYFAVGLNPGANHFFVYLLTLILIYNASSGYSLIISAIFSNKQVAVTLTPVLIVPFMLFAGFFVASSSIPIWLREFEYLSIFKYGY